MKTLRTLLRMAPIYVAAICLALPAAAQEKVEPDSIKVEKVIAKFFVDVDGAPRLLEDIDVSFQAPTPFRGRVGYPGLLKALYVDLPGEHTKRHAEVTRMEMESRRLAVKARKAEGDERSRLEAELNDSLDKIFELKQQIREEKIEALRQQFEEVVAEHDDRQANKEEIIERRRSQLLGSSRYKW